MKVLLVGVGGVGEAIATIAKTAPWVEQMVLADYNLERAQEVQAKLGDHERFPAEFVDAGKQEMIEALAKKYKVDLIMNACDPLFNEPIFDAAYNTGETYMDMAMTLSEPHPDDPFNQCGIKLGDYQFERADQWEKKGLLCAGRAGCGAGHGGCLRPLRPRSSVRRDRRDRRPRWRQPGSARLRVCAELLDLDDHRRMPEPAGDLGEGQGLVHHRALL